LRLAGRFEGVAALIFGQMVRCDEPSEALDRPTARSVIAEFFADFRGPILYGFPSGHTMSPFVTLPFGVQTRVIAGATPTVVIEEAAAA
jgi:muramoyltetrapeptide carboxypeptidase LdcA involved in peptidoglycan recycling